jgi:hypothetical protein
MPVAQSGRDGLAVGPDQDIGKDGRTVIHADERALMSVDGLEGLDALSCRRMHQGTRRGWKVIERTGVVLGIVAAVVAIAQAFKPLRHVTADVIDYLWPGWIVSILVVAGLLLFALFLDRERQLQAQRTELARVKAERDRSIANARSLSEKSDPERRDHDQRIIRQILEVMPRGSARFLTQHDFGGSWSWDDVRPVHTLAENFDEVEHRLLDPELELARRELIDAARELSRALGQHSARLHGATNQFAPIPPLEMDMPPEGEAGGRWRRAQALLNELSTRVAEAYDRLVAAANERLYL